MDEAGGDAEEKPLKAVDSEQFLANMRTLLQLEREEEDDESAQILQGLGLPASVRKGSSSGEQKRPAVEKIAAHELGRYCRALEAAGKALTALRATEAGGPAAVGGSPTVALVSRRAQHDKEADTGTRGGVYALNRTGFSSGDAVAIVGAASSRNQRTIVSKGKKGKDSNEGGARELMHELRGVIGKVTPDKIVVVLNEKELPTPDMLSFALFDSSLMLLKLSDDVTYHRLNRAVDRLENTLYGAPYCAHARPVLEVILGSRKPTLNTSLPPPFRYFNSNLNEGQKDAVLFCLQSQEVALIHGPPGTGKTTTVAELILQTVNQGKRVLACAASNIAVDNLAMALAPFIKKGRHNRVNIVRAGHPARVLPEVLEHSLERQLKRSDGGQIVQDIRKELSETQRQLQKRNFASKGERRQLYGSLKVARKELKEREKKALEDLIGQAAVVMSTNTGADSKYLWLPAFAQQVKGFDLVVIDEAGKPHKLHNERHR